MTLQKSGSQYDKVLEEISSLFVCVQDNTVHELVEKLIETQRIVVFGAGRERLQIMGFAMRMFHLGMDISVVGDMTTPPVGTNDTLLMTCGPGELSTATALAKKAKSDGAEVIMITAQPDGDSVKFADFVLTLPAQTMANDQGQDQESILPMGSIFEGALFVLFEVMVLRLKEKLNVNSDDMRSNHTNLE